MSIEPNEKWLAVGFALILRGLGLDPNSPHLKDTPDRAARAWFNELCSGLTQPAPEITAFRSGVDQMIILQHIPIRSLCSHHLLPFYGQAAVAYIPGNGHILGLSKLSRIADYYARRPQVQEELTLQIAERVAQLVTKPPLGGVGVVIRAEHMCMALRGVTHDGPMITSAMRGLFRKKASVRNEFLQLISGDNK